MDADWWRTGHQVLETQLQQANRELSEMRVQEMMKRGNQEKETEAGSFDGEIARMMVQRAKEELDDAKVSGFSGSGSRIQGCCGFGVSGCGGGID